MSTACKPGLSWKEAADCADFAERVIKHAQWMHAPLPQSACVAEAYVRSYNQHKGHYSYFKVLYGYSIRGYIPYIVENIGLIVAEMEV